MKETILPNVVQTLEGNLALVHGGPFANIAHGCNSIIATDTAMKDSDYVITEAGFGADLGAEKFLNIKSRVADLSPDLVVVVATIRAIKMQGGVSKDNLLTKNIDALEKGIEVLQHHINIVKSFNLNYVVAINSFVTDIEEEKLFVEK